MNGALVVMIDPDLPPYRRNGILHVQSVAAIESISAETLLAMLLKPVAEPPAPPEPWQADLFSEAPA